MRHVRSFLIAALLMLSAVPSWAQPAPVPALPDSARLTTYSISASQCGCAVNFALFGSGTDVDQLIQVFVNGTAYLSTDTTFGWSLSSATGSLGSIPRPITNAVLTFNAVQTGTVQIVGAERPRRLSQFSENRGTTARDLNQALTDQVAVSRETWDKLNRAIVGQPGEVLTPLPSATARANLLLGFGNTGQPVAVAVSNTLTTNGLNIWTGLQTFAGGIAVTSTTSPLIADGTAALFQNGSKTALQIYCSFSFNGCNLSTGGTIWDGVRSVVNFTAGGGSLTQADAFGAYVNCAVTTGGSYPNKNYCNGYFGMTVLNATGATGWVATYECEDTPDNLIYTTHFNRTCNSLEVDIGTNDNGGTFQGNGVLAVLQGSGTNFASAIAFNIRNASAAAGWSFGLACGNQAIGIACINAGVQSTGANSVSQLFAWQYSKSSSQFAMEMWAAATGGFVFAATDTSIGVAFDWSAVTINTCALKLAAGCVINGSGIVPLAFGGTNASLTASNGGIVYSTASAFAVLAGTGSAGQCLLSGSNAAPTWGSCGSSAGITVGTSTITSGTTQQILYDNGGVLGEITKGNNCVYGTGGTGIPSCLATLPSAVQSNITTVGTIGTGIWGGSIIDISRGGTSAALTASNGGIFYSTASAGAILSGTATASLPLLSGSSAAPTWATVSHPTSATSGGIPYFSSTSVMATSALLGANCIVYGGGAGTAPATSSSTCPTVSSAGAVAIANATASGSSSTGALTVAGGVGITGDIHSAGSFFGVAMALTAASSITTNAQFVGLSLVQQSTGFQVAVLQCLNAGCDNGGIALSLASTIKTLIQASGASYFNGGNVCFGATSCSNPVSVTGNASVTGAFVAAGTVPVGSTGTCATGVTVTGGATIGLWTSTAACNVGGTIILSTMPTAPNGYSCDANDRTTAAVVLQQTASTVNSVTFTVRTNNAAANDNIQFKCLAY
jgi:hypothetical protein